MAQLALAWSLRGPEVTSAIIGATCPSQVDDDAATSSVTLTDDVLAACDATPTRAARRRKRVAPAIPREGA